MYNSENLLTLNVVDREERGGLKTVSQRTTHLGKTFAISYPGGFLPATLRTRFFIFAGPILERENLIIYRR